MFHSMVSSNTFPVPPAKQPCTNPSQENHYSYKPKQKCATFTNVGKETTFITKIFRKTNLTVTFKTCNAIEYNLRAKQKCTHNNNNNNNKYFASGIYKLACLDCGKAYVGQTGKFSLRDSKNIV